ncbi:MAG: hypothetical protein AB7W59_01985 [Acidimicrobiia bacterium]
MDRHQLMNLSAPDAVVALRSYARRFRELFSPAEAQGEDLDVAAVGRDGWSVGALLAAIDGHLAAVAAGLGRSLTVDEPALPALFERPTPGAAAGHAPVEVGPGLAKLEATVLEAAGLVERTAPRDWSRPAQVGGAASTAHELLRELIAYGRTALDLLARAVADARRAAN